MCFQQGLKKYSTLQPIVDGYAELFDVVEQLAALSGCSQAVGWATINYSTLEDDVMLVKMTN